MSKLALIKKIKENMESRDLFLEIFKEAKAYVDYKAFARKIRISAPTVERYFLGKSQPHQIMISGLYKELLKELE